MTVATPPPNHAIHTPATVDTAPPTRSKVTGALAALACAACCAIPLLIVAGVVSGAAAAILQAALLGVAAGLAVIALGMWWRHRRQNAQNLLAAGQTPGCDNGNCNC